MAGSLSTTLKVNLSGAFTETDSTFGNSSKAISHITTITTANGTSASQANKIYTQSGTVTDSGVTIDLAGSVEDVFGDTITLAKLCGIIVVNNSEEAGENIQVGAGTNAVAAMFGAAADYIVIGPSGILVLWAPMDGYTVTGGSADEVELTASSGDSISYEFVAIGRTS